MYKAAWKCINLPSDYVLDKHVLQEFRGWEMAVMCPSCDCRDLHGVSNVLLLDSLREHYPVIEIRIKECKGMQTSGRYAPLSWSSY